MLAESRPAGELTVATTCAQIGDGESIIQWRGSKT